MFLVILVRVLLFIMVQYYTAMTILFFFCTSSGDIVYADPIAQRWSTASLENRPFLSLLPFGEDRKGEHFLKAVRDSDPECPTSPWELIIGTSTNYTVATLRGYRLQDNLVIIACTESEELKTMQQSMDELTSELTQAQRQLRRQNHLLQQALYDQRVLVRRLMKMTLPNIPVWDASLILSLTREKESDDHLLETLKEMWGRAGEPDASHIILDMSNMEDLNTNTITRLLTIVRLFRALNLQPLLADAGSGMSNAINQLGLDLQGASLHKDVRQAIMHIGTQQEQQTQPTTEADNETT